MGHVLPSMFGNNPSSIRSWMMPISSAARSSGTLRFHWVCSRRRMGVANFFYTYGVFAQASFFFAASLLWIIRWTPFLGRGIGLNLGGLDVDSHDLEEAGLQFARCTMLSKGNRMSKSQNAYSNSTQWIKTMVKWICESNHRGTEDCRAGQAGQPDRHRRTREPNREAVRLKKYEQKWSDHVWTMEWQGTCVCNVCTESNHRWTEDCRARQAGQPDRHAQGNPTGKL